MILAKSCHDMDILRHLVGVAPRRISSFGSLSHFRPENAPQGAPDYCLDGCPAEAQCPYHVSKIYLTDETDPAYLRQMGVVDDRSLVAEMLRTHPFGRCGYHCDHNVVDHQVVQIEFEGDPGPFNMPLTVRVTTADERGYPVTAEAKIEAVRLAGSNSRS